MTSKNNRALLLYYVKLCASFQIHGWPWKTTGHLSYAASSFVHHFIDIGEFTLALQSGNAQIGQIRRFFSRVTLKFNGWPWKTIRQLFYTTSSFVHHFKSIGEVKLEFQSWNAQFGSKLVIFFVPRDLGIWWINFKNNRSPFLCCFKLFASFRSHWSIQTGVTVRKRPIWVKLDNF